VYKGKTILAVITARGGSKGLPNKNLLLLAGRPLVAWSVLQAKASRYVDRVIFSSEDARLIKAAKAAGADVPFVRPKELAQDSTPGMLPFLHAITAIPEKYDYVMLLQPTSPLREPEDIDACIRLCMASGAPACVSVKEVSDNPYWTYRLGASGRLRSTMGCRKTIERRQDLPKVYALNGSIYIAEREHVLRKKTFITPRTAGYVMPEERSADIDTAIDFKLVELLLKEKRRGGER